MSDFELSPDGKVALAEARSRVAAFNEAVAANSLRPSHVPFLYVEQLIAELDRACKALEPKQEKPVHWLCGARGLTCAGELVIGTVVADSLDEVTCMMCLRALAQRTLAAPAIAPGDYSDEQVDAARRAGRDTAVFSMAVTRSMLAAASVPVQPVVWMPPAMMEHMQKRIAEFEAQLAAQAGAEWTAVDRGLAWAAAMCVLPEELVCNETHTAVFAALDAVKHRLAAPAAFIAARDSEIASLREAVLRETERADKAEAATVIEPLSDEERFEIEDCRHMHKCGIAVADGKLNAMLRITESRFHELGQSTAEGLGAKACDMNLPWQARECAVQKLIALAKRGEASK